MTHHAVSHAVTRFAGLVLPCLLAVTGLALTSPPAAMAQRAAAAPAEAAAPSLSDQRWRETSYGLSLLPPVGSRLIELSADDAVLRIHGPIGKGNFVIKVYIKERKDETRELRFNVETDKKNPAAVPAQQAAPRNGGEGKALKPLTLDQITQMAIEQIADSQPWAVLLQQKKVQTKVAPASVLFFKLGDKKRGTWVLGQAFMQVSPLAVAMLQLEVDEAQYAQMAPLFEAVLASIELDDPKILDGIRAEQITRGKVWRQQITSKTLHDSLQPEQWFRITDGDRDIGYMRVTQKTDKQADMPGVRIDVQTRIDMGEQAVDSLSNFFLSDDGKNEIWSMRTTIRPLKTPKPGGPSATPTEATWSETGIRELLTATREEPEDKQRISVTREGPEGKKTFTWDVPTHGYISQVECQMLDTLLPHDNATDMGFYAYSFNTGRLTYRTERIVPGKDGNVMVYSRPLPEQPEQVSQFRVTGGLVKRTLPSGQAIVPSTRQDLLARWQIK